MDWNQIREQFPATQGQTWLNTATYGPAPQSVIDAVHEANEKWGSGRGEWPQWEADGELAREGFAQLVGVDPGSVALLPAVSVAAGQVAENLEYVPGANIVLGESEFRSNFYPWMAQGRRGFEVRTVPFEQGRLPADRLIDAIDADTAIVAVSSVQSLNGYRIDLEKLSSVCRDRGVRLFVDATQSVGVMRVPFALADYVAVSGYKYLMAPRGTTFLYVRSELIGSMSPMAPGWKTPEQPYGDYYGPPYEPPVRASRFDISLAWAPWVGAARGLEYLLELGIEAIESRALALARQFSEGLPAIGLKPLFAADESSQIVALAVPDPESLKKAFEEANIVAAVRGEFLRVSFHFFNDESDVEYTLDTLGRSL